MQTACPILMVKILSLPDRKTISGEAHFTPSRVNAFLSKWVKSFLTNNTKHVDVHNNLTYTFIFGQFQTACPIRQVKRLPPFGINTTLGKVHPIPSRANVF